MNGTDGPWLAGLLRAVVRRRWLVVAAYAILVPLAIAQAMRIESDSSIDRLIVQGDPDFLEEREFRRLFPEREQVVLLALAADTFAPQALARVAEIERRLGEVPGVRAFSALTLFERARPGSGDAAARAVEFGAFVRGSDLFRRQGLAGPGFLGLPIEFEARDAAARDATLAAIDQALAPIESRPAPLERIGRVGGPYV